MKVADYQDYRNAVAKSYGKSKPRQYNGSQIALHCPICDLEGCKRSNHVEWDYDEHLRAMGGNDY